MTRIKMLREKLGLSQLELAHRVGISQVCLCRYESGERSPSYQILKRIATELNSTVDYLIGESA